MKAPAFWQNPADRPGWQAHLLSPLGGLYGRLTAKRITKEPRFHAPCPVICVGNLNAGGTGKTPTTIALLEWLRTHGKRAHVISRGYGGTLEGPVAVDPKTHRADEVGDEPLLISQFAPVFVGKDRAAAARHAVAGEAPDVLIMDDGFQNPDLHKDLSLIIVDAETGFGNGRCIPAGPLREKVGPGLARADAMLSIGPEGAQQNFERDWAHQIPCPRFTAQLAPLQTGIDWTDMPVFAFAGIGRPEKFFATLRGLGARLAGHVALDDHQPLSDALMARMSQDATRAGAQLVTTEKDAIRLPKSYRREVLTLPVRLNLDEAEPFDSFMRQALSF